MPAGNMGSLRFPRRDRGLTPVGIMGSLRFPQRRRINAGGYYG